MAITISGGYSHRSGPAQKLSLGAPVFNESEGLSRFLSDIDAQAFEIKQRCPGIQAELLLVDDGSTDGSSEIVKQYHFKHFERVVIHELSRNFGHTGAITALLEVCDSDALVLMDADLQDDPNILPVLVEKWREGFDSVRVLRGKRKEGRVFSVFSGIFYGIFRRFSGLQSGLGIFGLYSREVIRAIRKFPERVRYTPGIISLAGFNTCYVTVDRQARLAGESRVGFSGLFKLGLQAWISFSAIPIYMVTAFGLITSLLAGVAGVTVIGIKLFSTQAIPGWASFLTAQFFLGGVIIFCVGIVGQYVGIIFEEIKSRPLFLIKSTTEIKSQVGGQDVP